MIWWILADVCLGLELPLLVRIGWRIFHDRAVGWKTGVAYVLLACAAYSCLAMWLTETSRFS